MCIELCTVDNGGSFFFLHVALFVALYPLSLLFTSLGPLAFKDPASIVATACCAFLARGIGDGNKLLSFSDCAFVSILDPNLSPVCRCSPVSLAPHCLSTKQATAPECSISCMFSYGNINQWFGVRQTSSNNLFNPLWLIHSWPC